MWRDTECSPMPDGELLELLTLLDKQPKGIVIRVGNYVVLARGEGCWIVEVRGIPVQTSPWFQQAWAMARKESPHASA